MPVSGSSRRKESATVDIHYLADHRGAIPLLASWIYNEWSFLYPGKSVQYIESLLRKRIHKKRLPFTLVAVASGKPVGTVSLKDFDMETRNDLTPWIASLYVSEPWRRKGVGSMLMKAVEQKAAGLNIKKLFLFTSDDGSLVRFYRRLGWTIREKTAYQNYDVVIMEKDISMRGRRPARFRDRTGR